MAKIEEKRKLNNFRELIDYAEETYGDNICYKYKKDIKEKPATIVETTFKTVATKVRGLATFILNYEKEMKRMNLDFIIGSVHNIDGVKLRLYMQNKNKYDIYYNYFNEIYERVKNSDIDIVGHMDLKYMEIIILMITRKL